jgi:hypothetical protein
MAKIPSKLTCLEFYPFQRVFRKPLHSLRTVIEAILKINQAFRSPGLDFINGFEELGRG